MGWVTAGSELDVARDILAAEDMGRCIRYMRPGADDRRALINEAIVFYASTNKVYGGLDARAVEETATRYRFVDRPSGIDEHEALDFHSPYGCSKGCGDQYVRDYARMYGLRTVVFRQSCIYGTRQFGVEDQGWVAHFCLAARFSRPLTIYGNGKQVRDVLFVEDLVAAYDVIIPRGGKGLIERISRDARVPVIKHLDGICHVYVDDRADLDKALAVAMNAKTQRYGTCNTMETLLVAAGVAGEFLPRVGAALAAAGVKLRGCERTRAVLGSALPATEADWDTEYLAPILAIRVVDGLDAAIDHIERHGSHHTDSIVTEDYGRARRFLREVDSSSVMVNASTRFADGFEYGLGAEHVLVGVEVGVDVADVAPVHLRLPGLDARDGVGGEIIGEEPLVTLDGREVGLYFVEPNDYFAELALIDNEPLPELPVARRQLPVGFEDRAAALITFAQPWTDHLVGGPERAAAARADGRGHHGPGVSAVRADPCRGGRSHRQRR